MFSLVSLAAAMCVCPLVPVRNFFWLSVGWTLLGRVILDCGLELVCVGNQVEVFFSFLKPVSILGWQALRTMSLLMFSRFQFAGQVPYPGVIVIIETQSCCCILYSNDLHTPVVATEYIFFADQKGGGGRVKVRLGDSP